MAKFTQVFALATVLAFGMTAPALAHEGHDHIAGSVSAATEKRLEIKTTDGKIVAVTLTAKTVFTKDKKPATAAEVKPGLRVVVDTAKGKDGLEATEVQIGVAETANAVYTCPMHPEVKESKAGKCPKCGMNLVLAEKKPDEKKPHEGHGHGM